MGNNLTSNPMRVDTAGIIIPQSDIGVIIQGMEWINDTSGSGAIATGNLLSITMNGVNFQITATGPGNEPWMSALANPMNVTSLTVVQIDKGVLLIWKMQ